MRDCRARAESLLLLLFSTDAAETLLEAAVHHPRAAAAARRVVGGAQASLFTSAAVLPVRAPVVCGRLGRVGAVRDARVGQDERESVSAGRVCMVSVKYVGPLSTAVERSRALLHA